MEQDDVPAPLTAVMPPLPSSSSSGSVPATPSIPVLIATFEHDIARLCQELHSLADCRDKPSLARAKAIDETIDRLQRNTAQLKDMSLPSSPCVATNSVNASSSTSASVVSTAFGALPTSAVHSAQHIAAPYCPSSPIEVIP
jgi:hypothetical protein